jgi:hypothetical protein
MKRTKFFAVFLIFLLPAPFINAQEKMTEKKITVVIDNGSGKEILMDTVLYGDNGTDSVILKNGEVFYVNKTPENKYGNPVNKDEKGEKKYRIIARVEKNGKQSGDRYVYINNENGSDISTDGETFDISTDEDISGNDFDKTRYVIAKDGITVTVEGKDDAKVQELVKEIEKKLDIGGEKAGAGETVKGKDTKSIKRK